MPPGICGMNTSSFVNRIPSLVIFSKKFSRSSLLIPYTPNDINILYDGLCTVRMWQAVNITAALFPRSIRCQSSVLLYSNQHLHAILFHKTTIIDLYTRHFNNAGKK